MQTIEYRVLTANFAEHTQRARMGHAVLVTRRGQPCCIVAHPTLLTEVESRLCERITSTRMYARLGSNCHRVEREKAKFIITAHGVARCCIVPPDFKERAQKMDEDVPQKRARYREGTSADAAGSQV